MNKYKDKLKKVSRDEFFLEILSYTNLRPLEQKPIKSEKIQQELINSSVNKVFKDLNNLLTEIKN